MRKPADRAIQGVRAIDFSQWLAGPTVAMVLGDLGADVIRVDPPGGPSWADPVNTLLQRGKRSIALDLTASVLDTLGMAAALDQLVAASVVATGLPEGEDMIGRFRAPGAAPAQNPN